MDLDGWLDDVPEPAGLQPQHKASNEVSETVVSAALPNEESPSLNEPSPSETLTPDMFGADFEDDWFTEAEDTAPLIAHTNTSAEANTQTPSDLEEISDFDDEDDMATALFVRPSSIPSMKDSDNTAEPLRTDPLLDMTAEASPKASTETSVDSSDPEPDDLDWFDNTETADFMLSDFGMDELTAEAQEQSIDDINEFSIDDDIEANDIAPNESDIKATAHIEIEANSSKSTVLSGTDIFTQGSLLSTENELTEFEMTEQSIQEEKKEQNPEDKDDDWFADVSSAEGSSTTISQPNPKRTDDTSMPKWIMVAGAVVVAGGAWSATQTRQVDTPSVHIDENKTKVTEDADRFIPTEKTTVTADVEKEGSVAEDT